MIFKYKKNEGCKQTIYNLCNQWQQPLLLSLQNEMDNWPFSLQFNVQVLFLLLITYKTICNFHIKSS